MIKLVIPAAGKGKRTNLNYPKTLYEINNKPIIMNIIETCKFFDDAPLIISSNSGQLKINKVLNKFKIKNEILIQHKRLGMADAVSKIKLSKYYNSFDNFLIIWSDLIKPNQNTISKLIKYHYENKNDFSIATIDSKNCYTKVIRKKRKIIKIEELKSKNIKYSGERDVGIFLINKSVINCLIKNKKKLLINKEYSFLKLVEICVKNNLNVEGYKIASSQDLLSFNSFEDIKCL